MSDIILFKPRAEVDAKQRVEDFEVLARDRLNALVSQDNWDNDVWDVSPSFVRKGKPNVVSRLHFFQHGTLVGRGDASTGIPFDTPFREFARACIRYHYSVAPMTFEPLRARLWALSHVDAAFKSLGLISDITKLSANVLHAAVRIGGEGLGGAVRYQRAQMIQIVFDFCREHGFLAASLVWKHGVRKVSDPTERIGVEFAERRAAKLPSRKAIDVLGHAYCKPKNYRDKLFTAVTAICMCVPIRIYEVLQLRANCGCDEERRNDEGRMVPAFGVRVLPGKGNAPQVKWVPDVMEDPGHQAITRLTDLSASARFIAAWYVKNPTRLYLPPEVEYLRNAPFVSTAQLGDLVGAANSVQWAHNNNLQPTTLAGQAFSYRFEDLEAAVLAQLPKDFPLHNGQADHPYSESLIIVRRGSMRADTIGLGSRVMFEPISIDAYNRWLSGSVEHKSIFERYGFVEEDGSEIEQTSHGFRHWLNDVAHRRGMSAMDIAHWSGRDPTQNKYYDHQTPAQFHAQLQDLAEKAGGIGPLFEAADALPDNQPISRAEFLAAQIGSAHHTDLGACIHDYSLLPCQRHGNCLGCEENVFIKGDLKHRGSIEERHALTLKQLQEARSVMNDGEYGANLWVRDHQEALHRLALMLSIHDDPDILGGTLVTISGNGDDTEVSLALRQRDAKVGAG